MKLTELEPKWTVTHEYGEYDETIKANPKRHGMGIIFRCPVCGNHRIGVMFSNPIDGLPAGFGIDRLWKRDGKTFDTLTITPSINVQDGIMKGTLNPNPIMARCWHGNVTGGYVS